MNNIFNKIYRFLFFLIRPSFWFLFFLIRPSFWFMNYNYNIHLDTMLRKRLIDGEKFTSIDNYYASFGGVKLWIETYPFACMIARNRSTVLRPSREVIYKLKKQLERDIGDKK